ncbi:ATP-binding protein [Ramlibacter sp. WS9]|uniref:ATP-binding protein n=1 Tax=Ramlibacter sp. WS9 TaxID=1882741 RepID=UPI001E30BF2C|nr:ATP-binding protein [Ramlibacter sp. WS9]
MKLVRLWPASLFGRITLILFLGLAAAHTLSFWLVFVERGMAMRDMMVSYLARDVASSVAILERVPAAERPQWLRLLERRNYRFVLDPPPPGAPAQSRLAQEIGIAVASALESSREVVAVEPGDASPGVRLRIHLKLADGTPVAVELGEPQLEVSPWVFAVLAAQLALLALLTWLAVRSATRPLAQLADAADAIGPAAVGTALAETGPREVARAATAFNAMQGRIQAHLAERTQILAAISHDLQTPLTRLRLRSELIDDAVLQGKLLADLDAMQALVREGIAYARSAHSGSEATRSVDLHALLDSLVCDYTDAGQPVTLEGGEGLLLDTRPQALRRLVTNLVDNALKFAGNAQLTAGRGEHGIFIVVRDDGPGIAPEELQAVMQPFYRVENSRSRETGGTGLGLAIAQQLAQALGGQLALRNREEGGLEARLTLPIKDVKPSA